MTGKLRFLMTANSLRPRRHLPLFFLLGKEAVFVEPAQRDAGGGGGNPFRLLGDGFPEPGLCLTLIHVRFEADEDIAMTADLRAVSLLMVDVEVAAPLFHPFSNENDAAFLVAIP